MFDPKASKNPKAKTLASLMSEPPETMTVSDPGPSQDQIRERAYQLYESRGRQTVKPTKIGSQPSSKSLISIASKPSASHSCGSGSIEI